MDKIQLLVASSIVLLLTGCSGAKIPGLVPAEGIVLLDGQPVEEANIVFSPLAGGGDRYATSISRSGGKFVLETVGNRGALPGRYEVMLSKKETVYTVSSEEAERLEAAGRRIPSETTYYIPWKYEDTITSGIVIEIGPKGNKDIRIELEQDNTPPPRSLI
jgi:hypothetical protein